MTCITAVDGSAVDLAPTLHTTVSAHRPGDTVKVAWTDASGKTHSARVRLGSGPVG